MRIQRSNYLLLALVALPFVAACGGSDGGGGGAETFKVGGQLSDLEGDQLILRLNGDESLTVESNGAFQFNTELEDGESYTVSAQVLPEAPAQNCDFANESGAISGADVDDVDVSCHAAIDMLGRVAGPVVKNATVTAEIGDETYETEADEQGMYTLRPSVRDPQDMVYLEARDPVDDFILYRGYLGSLERVQGLATEDRLLTREQTVAVNVTSVSTATAALMRWLNDGQAPLDEAERRELKESVTPGLMLNSAALVQIAVADESRNIVPPSAGASSSALVRPASAANTSELIEDQAAREAYEEEVNEQDPNAIDDTVGEILEDEDLVEGVDDEGELPESWFAVTTWRENSITGDRYRFEADNTGSYANHIDSVTYGWAMNGNVIDITLDEALTTAGFCFVEDENGDEYQTACVAEIDEFEVSLVEEDDEFEVLSVHKAGTRHYPDEPDRESHAIDFREDVFGYRPDNVEFLDEAEIADTVWSMPGDFPARVGGMAWYGDELLEFVSGGTGQASESGAFNWAFNQDGWLEIEFGNGASHQLAVMRRDHDPAVTVNIQSLNSDGDPRSTLTFVAPRLDDAGVDETFASDLFMQWGTSANDFAVDVREAGWGGYRRMIEDFTAYTDFLYEFDYRFDGGDLIMESWAQPMDNGEEWWGRESICDGSQQEDCYLTLRRTWTLLHDDGSWITLLERVENLDSGGNRISYSPRTIRYQRFEE